MKTYTIIISFWRKKYFSPEITFGSKELNIFAGIDFCECYEIKYFAVPNFHKFAKVSYFKVICNANKLTGFYLIQNNFVQGNSEQTINIFCGTIALLWTSNRNHENEPVECL